jgi:hypothetical protein
VGRNTADAFGGTSPESATQEANPEEIGEIDPETGRVITQPTDKLTEAQKREPGDAKIGFPLTSDLQLKKQYQI